MQIYQRPSMPIAWPVTKLAPSDARNAIVAATSSGDPKRPTGISLARSRKPSSRSSPYSRRLVLMALVVRIGPGHTAFTVMPNGARSRASDLVKPTMAAFDAAYVARRRPGRNAALDETLTIRPQPALRIAGTAARDIRKAPLALTPMVRSQALTGTFSISLRSAPCGAPALLTR